MVTKRKSTSEKEVKKGRVKVGKLKFNKETVKNLVGKEEKQIKGGAVQPLIYCSLIITRCGR